MCAEGTVAGLFFGQHGRNGGSHAGELFAGEVVEDGLAGLVKEALLRLALQFEQALEHRAELSPVVAALAGEQGEVLNVLLASPQGLQSNAADHLALGTAGRRGDKYGRRRRPWCRR